MLQARYFLHIFQKIEAYRKNKRLVFFDMDNTLIDIHVSREEALMRLGAHRPADLTAALAQARSAKT